MWDICAGGQTNNSGKTIEQPGQAGAGNCFKWQSYSFNAVCLPHPNPNTQLRSIPKFFKIRTSSLIKPSPIWPANLLANVD